MPAGAPLEVLHLGVNRYWQRSPSVTPEVASSSVIDPAISHYKVDTVRDDRKILRSLVPLPPLHAHYFLSEGRCTGGGDSPEYTARETRSMLISIKWRGPTRIARVPYAIPARSWNESSTWTIGQPSRAAYADTT